MARMERGRLVGRLAAADEANTLTLLSELRPRPQTAASLAAFGRLELFGTLYNLRYHIKTPPLYAYFIWPSPPAVLRSQALRP